MPAYSKDQGNYHISRIRTALILRPDASQIEIQEMLEESPDAPLHLNAGYIGKLRDKIFKERAHRNDRLNLNVRLATIQDKKKMIDARLWAEATNLRSPAMARIAALEKLLRSDLELLQSEMDAGVFTRKLGEVDVEHTHKIAPDQLTPILKTLQLYGLIKLKTESAKLPDARTGGVAS